MPKTHRSGAWRAPVEATRPGVHEPAAAVAAACHLAGLMALTCGTIANGPRLAPPPALLQRRRSRVAGQRPADDGGQHLHL